MLLTEKTIPFRNIQMLNSLFSWQEMALFFSLVIWQADTKSADYGGVSFLIESFILEVTLYIPKKTISYSLEVNYVILSMVHK